MIDLEQKAREFAKKYHNFQGYATSDPTGIVVDGLLEAMRWAQAQKVERQFAYLEGKAAGRKDTLAEVEQMLTDYGVAFKASKQGDITHEWVVKACIMRVAALRKQETDTP